MKKKRKSQEERDHRHALGSSKWKINHSVEVFVKQVSLYGAARTPSGRSRGSPAGYLHFSSVKVPALDPWPEIAFVAVSYTV